MGSFAPWKDMLPTIYILRKIDFLVSGRYTYACCVLHVADVHHISEPRTHMVLLCCSRAGRFHTEGRLQLADSTRWGNSGGFASGGSRENTPLEKHRKSANLTWHGLCLDKGASHGVSLWGWWCGQSEAWSGIGHGEWGCHGVVMESIMGFVMGIPNICHRRKKNWICVKKIARCKLFKTERKKSYFYILWVFLVIFWVFFTVFWV